MSLHIEGFMLSEKNAQGGPHLVQRLVSAKPQDG